MHKAIHWARQMALALTVGGIATASAANAFEPKPDLPDWAIYQAAVSCYMIKNGASAYDAGLFAAEQSFERFQDTMLHAFESGTYEGHIQDAPLFTCPEQFNKPTIKTM